MEIVEEIVNRCLPKIHNGNNSSKKQLMYKVLVFFVSKDKTVLSMLKNILEMKDVCITQKGVYNLLNKNFRDIAIMFYYEEILKLSVHSIGIKEEELNLLI